MRQLLLLMVVVVGISQVLSLVWEPPYDLFAPRVETRAVQMSPEELPNSNGRRMLLMIPRFIHKRKIAKNFYSLLAAKNNQ